MRLYEHQNCKKVCWDIKDVFTFVWYNYLTFWDARSGFVL